MAYQFKNHYTREEAKALLPQVRLWLQQLERFQTQLQKYDQRLTAILESGSDAGGEVGNSWVRAMADVRDVLNEFESREIQVKDLQRGLLDFPAIIGGREVFLCWEKDEDDVEFWHDLDTGYGGRERL
jgi:hypothetical protein